MRKQACVACRECRKNMRRGVAEKVSRGQTRMSPDRGSQVLDHAFCECHGSEAGVVLYGGTIGKMKAM